MVEGGDQLARSQIAAGAEDDDGARLDWLAAGIKPAGQQLIQMVRLFHDPQTMPEAVWSFNNSWEQQNEFCSTGRGMRFTDTLQDVSGFRLHQSISSRPVRFGYDRGTHSFSRSKWGENCSMSSSRVVPNAGTSVSGIK